MANPIPFGKNYKNIPLEKPLPSNPDAEKSVLGAILLDGNIPNPTLKMVAEILHSGDFFDSRHERVFRAMLKMAESKKPVGDLVMLGDQLRADGELEAAGGDAYLAHLVDGVPRVSNVEHYARIVRDKSLQRAIIHKTHELQQRAFEGEGHDTLFGEMSEFTKHARGDNKSRLVAVGVHDFIFMKLEPLDWVIEPLLTIKGRGMIFATRGAGKTFVALYIAYCIARGIEDCFVWRIPKKRRVVYVDGEMDAETLQQRMIDIVKLAGGGDPPTNDELLLVTRDLQKDVRPKINTKAGRDQIEAHLEPGTVLILDNISSLSPSSDEQETEEWALMEDWFGDLCWRGITVLFVHHAGKGGDQRGTSKREDLLQFVLKLHVPSDHRMDEPLRAELHLTKLRGKCAKPIYGQPFELRLGTNEHGAPVWQIQQLRDLLRERARQMLSDGMRAADVVLETGLSRWAVARIARGLKFGPSAESQDPS
jgi:hypothetical protein